MLNEKFNRSEEAAIRRIIRKELDRSEKDIQKNMLKSKDLDKVIEDVIREMLQSYHNMFYREKQIISRKLRR